MKKLFISQPFHGRTEEEIFKERDYISRKVEELLDEKFYVIDQYHQDAPVVCPRFYYLSNDILMIEEADLIVFAPNFINAKGCMVEWALCRAYELNAFEFVEIKPSEIKLKPITFR